MDGDHSIGGVSQGFWASELFPVFTLGPCDMWYDRALCVVATIGANDAQLLCNIRTSTVVYTLVFLGHSCTVQRS